MSVKCYCSLLTTLYHSYCSDLINVYIYVHMAENLTALQDCDVFVDGDGTQTPNLRLVLLKV